MHHDIRDYANCASSFTNFATHLKVLDKNGPIPFKLEPYQIRLIEAYQQQRYVIARKIRNASLTTTSLAYLLWRCLFNEELKVYLYTNSTFEIVSLSHTVQRMLSYLPDIMKKEVNFNTVERILTIGSSKMHFMKYNQLNKTPSGTDIVDHLFLDESAFNPQMTHHWTCLRAIFDRARSVMIVSTTNGKTNTGIDNWFYNTYHDATLRKNSFYAFNMEHTEVPCYTPEYIAEIKKHLGEKGFRQEVLAEFVEEGSPHGYYSHGLEISENKNPPQLVNYNPGEAIIENTLPEPTIENLVADAYQKECRYEKDDFPQPEIRNKEMQKKLAETKAEDLAAKYGTFEEPLKEINRPEVTNTCPRPSELVHDFKPLSYKEFKSIFAKEQAKFNPEEQPKHPLFPDEFEISAEKLVDIYDDLSQDQERPVYKETADFLKKMYQRQDEKRLIEEEVKLPIDMLKLAGVVPVDAEECDPEDCNGDYRCMLMKAIVNEDLPEGMSLGLTEESLFVNGVPTKISSKGIEYLFLGLLELEGLDKALDVTSRLVRKKLQKVF